MKKVRILVWLLVATMLLPLLTGCVAQEAVTDLDEEGECYGPTVDLGALLDEGVPLSFAPLAAVSTVLTPTAHGKETKTNGSTVIDYSNAKDGYVMVKWTGGEGKIKVLIKGPNAGKGTYDNYQYNLRADGEYEVFPLSDGGGKYSIGIYKNTSGSQYATVLTATVM